MKNIFLMLLVLLLSFNSYATIMTQTGSWNLSDDIFVSTQINYTDIKIEAVLFSQFNPDLGNLIGVDFLRISGESNSRLYIRNLSQETGSFKYNTFNVNGYAAGVGLYHPTLDENRFFQTYSSGGDINLEPSQAWTLVAGGGIDEEGSYLQHYSGQDLDLFIGYGTFDMSPRIEINFNVTSISPDAKALFEINYAYSYSICYIYDPIPEPTTLSLLALGAILAGRKKITIAPINLR